MSAEHQPLPVSLDAERAVLGGVMLDPSQMAHADVVILEAEDFHSGKHQVLWRELQRRDREGLSLEMPAVVEDLAGTKLVDQVDGLAYVASLPDSVPTVEYVPTAARKVRDLATRRLMYRQGVSLMAAACDRNKTLDEVSDLASKASMLLSERDKRGEWSGYADIVDEVYDEIEQNAKLERLPQVGLPCGPLARLCVMERGDVWAVAARTRMGKTGFALGVAEHMARAGHGVAIVSLEMTKAKLVRRRVSRHTALPTQTLRRGRHADGGSLLASEWERIHEASSLLSELPIVIDDGGGLTPQDIRSRCYQAQRQLANRGTPLACVIVDHLGLVKTQGSSPYERATVAADEMQALAKRLNVLVIEVVQLSRGAEGRWPRIEDLRDSGKIEENARGIIQLYRPAEGRQGIEAERWQGYGVAIVSKQNDGETGHIWLDWLTVSGSWGDRELGATELPGTEIPGMAS